ncbi:TPA: LysR family transcriptional regulator [Klebsiella aerogenes]|uniref:LysR family transcriptional regulator n=1 Tax=Klebsiella TaxID=570 RepID=UPI0027E626E3|nr:LysR family transcriptional regulator [Klebsiella aerogenes]MDY0848260.1 LysR family transcriptional regulator [Klebsiella aerogenes]WPS33135.1 LysR family transcriptional regulator [Klebsiella aerogenes]HDU4322711.1 LysR family transcriptional regulator [Klebsiella aerogenes]
MGIFLSKKMKYFMVTMERRNFSLAADELCITRSPLSKVITEIESWLGGRLFIRRHNDLEPTSLAWDFYHKCKPLYYKTLSLESEWSSKKTQSLLTFHFDISIPELLFRQLVMIAQVEKIDAKFIRESIDVNDEQQLKYQSNYIMIATRPLRCNYHTEYSSWEGCPLVVLKSKYVPQSNQQNMFIWKDKNVDYMKEHYSHILSQSKILPSFIEHDFDIPTLLYAVRSGKGSLLMSQKMAQLYKIDGIEYQTLSGYHPRIYFYTNIDKTRQKSLIKFKEILSFFI